MLFRNVDYQELSGLIGYDEQIKHMDKFFYMNNDQYCFDGVLLSGANEMQLLVNCFASYLKQKRSYFVEMFDKSGQVMNSYLDKIDEKDNSYYVIALKLLDNKNMRLTHYCYRSTYYCYEDDEMNHVLKDVPIFSEMLTVNDSVDINDREDTTKWIESEIPLVTCNQEDLKKFFSNNGEDFLEFIGSLLCNLIDCEGYDNCEIYEEDL